MFKVVDLSLRTEAGVRLDGQEETLVHGDPRGASVAPGLAVEPGRD